MTGIQYWAAFDAYHAYLIYEAVASAEYADGKQNIKVVAVSSVDMAADHMPKKSEAGARSSINVASEGE